jgi:hypothetical protein
MVIRSCYQGYISAISSPNLQRLIRWPSTHQCTIQKKIRFWDFFGWDETQPNPRTGFCVHSFFKPSQTLTFNGQVFFSFSHPLPTYALPPAFPFLPLFPPFSFFGTFSFFILRFSFFFLYFYF